MKKTNKYNGMIYGMCIGVGVGTALGWYSIILY